MAFPAGVFFGVQSYAGAYTKKVTKSTKVDKKDLLTSAGEIGVRHAYKLRIEFKVEGGGTCTVDAGVGDPGITGLNANGTIIDDVTIDESQEDFNMFSFSGDSAPGAVTG